MDKKVRPMDAITAYESSSGMSHAEIIAARDAVLAQKSLTVAVFDDKFVPEMGVSPFIRRDDGIFIYRHRFYAKNSKRTQ